MALGRVRSQGCWAVEGLGVPGLQKDLEDLETSILHPIAVLKPVHNVAYMNQYDDLHASPAFVRLIGCGPVFFNHGLGKRHEGTVVPTWPKPLGYDADGSQACKACHNRGPV